ncbi:MAG: hypothetical protein K6U89_01400 [Chloroflexi bacterium]|nr:hypothetical protein [Chloroflexota bacterium]
MTRHESSGSQEGKKMRAGSARIRDAMPRRPSAATSKGNPTRAKLRAAAPPSPAATSPALPVAPETVVEIRDPAIDVPAILAEIRASLAQRGYTTEDWAAELPVFGQEETGDARWLERLRIDPEWAFLIDQVQEDARNLTLHVTVQPSPLPVVGGLLTRFKRAAHELVVFYANLQAARQRVLVGQLLAVVARVVAQQEALQREQRRLAHEVAALRERLESDGASR